MAVVRRSYWGTVWLRFRRNRVAVMGLIVAIFFWFVAIFAPLLANDRPVVAYVKGSLSFPVFTSENPGKSYEDWRSLRKHKGLSPLQKLDTKEGSGWLIWPLVPYSPTEHDLLEILSPPNSKHWFGTDDRGRDVLSRMIYGARVSLSVGVVAVGIATVIGIVMGGLAGYFGRWVDACINRLIEILLTIPTFFLIIAIIAFLPPSIYNIMVVIGLTGWTGIARFVRAEFLKLKTMDFVLALKALGASPARIIFIHMLPNAMAPVLVAVVFGVAGAILTESGLSFLGFGVPPPTPSWGDILSQSRDYVEFAWWLTVFPGAAIFLTITAYNVMGEGLRNAMDPRLM
jgi:peptide/nickel transport system permease protein